MEPLSYKEYLNEKQLAKIQDEIEIEINLDTTDHAIERQKRHTEEITDSEIIESVKASIPEIGERQLKGLDRIGQKYWIYSTNSFLNVIATFERQSDRIKMVVITVMKKEGFKGSSDSIKITI